MRKLQFERAEMESEEKSGEGRFTFREIFEYIKNGKYSEGLAKTDKLSLRKRAKFFQVVESSLYYVGGKYAHPFSCTYTISVGICLYLFMHLCTL